MNSNLQTNVCHPERVDAFFGGHLSTAEEREFTSHLNTCESCRRALEQMAAAPQLWNEAQELLQPSLFGVPQAADSEGASATMGHQMQGVLHALGPTDDPQMLGRIGGYEVLGIVGAGGMGVVLKAVDKSLDRTVAIKVLAPHLATSGAARMRFAREAKAAAAVLHPNVIAIHSVSNDDPLPYLVMPYVRGATLQKRLDAHGPFPVNEILRIGSQIAAGLAAANAQGLVHRDIKPANILLEEGIERVTITDFGLARAVDDATITYSGVIAGTPQYMSPEQARGEVVDQRSDLFSLGSVLYAICTGRPPFRAETTYGVMRRITDDEPTPIREINPDIPDWLCTIVARLMSKRANDRFASAAEVADLLARCLAHIQQPTTVKLPESLSPPPPRRSPFFSPIQGVLVMFTGITVSLLGLAYWQATPETPSPDRTDNINSAQQAQAEPPKAKLLPQNRQFFLAEPVEAIAMSPDGKRIAVTNSNPSSEFSKDWKRKVELLNAETGKVILSIAVSTPEEDALLAATDGLPRIEVDPVAFSPDGTVIAVGTGLGQVKLFDAHTGAPILSFDDEAEKQTDKKTPEKLKELRRAMGTVTGLAFSPDGSLLAMCGSSYDDVAASWRNMERMRLSVTGPGRLKIWDVKTGRRKHDLNGHSHVFATKFSSDGSLLVSVGRWTGPGAHGDGMLVWDPQAGTKEMIVQKQSNMGTNAVVFSPTNKLVAIASRHFDKENNTTSTAISVVYPKSGITEWERRFDGWAAPQGFSADGKNVLVMAGQTVQFIKTDSGVTTREVNVTQPKDVLRRTSFTIDQAGHMLVMGGISQDGKGIVEVWDLVLGNASSE